MPNLVTVPVPPSGVVDFFNPAGSTHVIADIVGYYGPATGEAGRFIGVVPERHLDTRPINAPLGPPFGIGILYLGFGGGVPADTVDAAVLNVTVTEPTDAGFLTVFDDDDCSLPPSSNLNFTPGQTVANQVVTGLSRLFPPNDCQLAPGIVGPLSARAAAAEAPSRDFVLVDAAEKG